MKRRVAIWPSPWNYKLKNGIFAAGFGPGGAYVRAFQLWRKAAELAGYQLDTWDEVPPGEASILWFVDLPRKRSVLEEARRLFPNVPAVLMICESPLICPQMFCPENRRLFDLVVTYETRPSATPKTLSYRLPVTIRTLINGPDFQDRRLLCMVNSNRVEGLFAVRQTGLEGLPGIGRLFNGWHSRVSDFVKPLTRDLYVERRRLARTADRYPDLAIDFFGKGWSGEQVSWLPFYPNSPYVCCRGKFVEERIVTLSNYRFTLAYENWAGDSGYITDRMFDGFLADAVPVYLGDSAVQEAIPEDSFIDARKFSSRDELLRYLNEMSCDSWNRIRRNGREFVKSARAQQFSDEAFAAIMTSTFKKLVPRRL